MGGGWRGVRVDVNGEVKLFVKILFFSFSLGGGGGGGGRGYRVDVNGEVKLL